MVKHRKGGKKAPPKVHAGETVETLASAHEHDEAAPTDASEPEAADDASDDVRGEPDDATANAVNDEVAEQVDAESAAVADEPAPGDMSTETVDETAPVPAEMDEPAEGDEVDDADEATDPLAAALAAEAAPRAVTPGVVLSDELPIDPDDDLRNVQGEASARLVSIVESLLFSAAKPMSVKDLRKVLQETSQHQIQLALRHLMEVTRSRGVVLAQVAGGFQFRTHPDNAVWVQKMLQAKPAKLSRTQIETLAIVAYRQPITRPEIDDIRGVDSGAVLKSMLERELIQIVGKKEEPGRPLLYGTTVRFLEFFNRRTLRDLPTLRDFRDLSEESKATLRQRLGDLQMAEALGQEVLGFIGAEEAGEGAQPEAAEAEAGAGEAAEHEAAEPGEGEAAPEGRVDHEPETGEPTERDDAGSGGESEGDDRSTELPTAPTEPEPAETEPSASPGPIVDPSEIPAAPTSDELLAEHDALMSTGEPGAAPEIDLSEETDVDATPEPPESAADAAEDVPEDTSQDAADVSSDETSADEDVPAAELADERPDETVETQDPADEPRDEPAGEAPRVDDELSPKTGDPDGTEQAHEPADTGSDREEPAE